MVPCAVRGCSGESCGLEQDEQRQQLKNERGHRVLHEQGAPASPTFFTAENSLTLKLRQGVQPIP